MILMTKKSKKVTSAITKTKKIMNIDDTDVNKILVSKKEQHGKYKSFTYFVGHNNVIRPLHLELSQMTGYINKFDENKNTITRSLKVKDKKLLKNYNKIWKKTESLMSINFDSKPIYGDDDKYIKNKNKNIWRQITTNFHNKKGSKKIPEEKIPYKCLSMILDSVLYAYKKISPPNIFRRM